MKKFISAILMLILILPISTDSQSSPTSVLSDGTLRRINVPILMYHYVSPLPADADDIRIGLTVEPHLLEAHLGYLRDARYNTISLNELHEALLIGTPLPENPIILTFDDSTIDHYTIAYPLLREYGFSGTFFVITGRADVNNPQHLSWAQIEEMSANGMYMEAHTKDHVGLSNRDHEFLVYQIMGSVESLEAHTNQQVTMFAYPAGRYDESTLQLMDTTNIWRAVTTERGSLHTTDNYYQLPRLRITGNLGVVGLQQLLNSAR